MRLSLTQWADVATVLGAIAGVLALVYTALQIRQNTRVHRAEFWLTLRQMFAEHKEVHLVLRNYDWPNDDITYPDEQDWARLEAYLGLLEHCEIMLSDGLLDWRTFEEVYGYRIRLILKNPLIVRDKLIRRREGWVRFLALVRRTSYAIAKRRYLCGFYDANEERWTMWWGRITHQQACEGERPWESPRHPDGCCHFATRPEMEAAYRARVRMELASATRLDHAWLIGDHHEVLHRWPEPPPGSPPHAGPARATDPSSKRGPIR